MGDFKANSIAVSHGWSALPARTSNFDKMTSVSTLDRMVRLVAALYVWALALASTQANAQAGATPPPRARRGLLCSPRWATSSRHLHQTSVATFAVR